MNRLFINSESLVVVVCVKVEGDLGIRWRFNARTKVENSLAQSFYYSIIYYLLRNRVSFLFNWNRLRILGWILGLFYFDSCGGKDLVDIFDCDFQTGGEWCVLMKLWWLFLFRNSFRFKWIRKIFLIIKSSQSLMLFEQESSLDYPRAVSISLNSDSLLSTQFPIYFYW